MVRTASTMLPLGTTAPDFQLPGLDGKMVKLADFQGKKGLLVIFMCNHCPYVKHVAAELVRLTNDYVPQGIAIVGIYSNDAVAYPDDSPEAMHAEAQKQGYTFPYLFDADQSVAQSYHAACTPDLFLFDSQMKLVYRGQIDDSRPKNGLPLTGADIRRAMDTVLAGKPPLEVQRPSIGCNIKWKAGEEPTYFDPKGVA